MPPPIALEPSLNPSSIQFCDHLDDKARFKMSPRNLLNCVGQTPFVKRSAGFFLEGMNPILTNFSRIHSRILFMSRVICFIRECGPQRKMVRVPAHAIAASRDLPLPDLPRRAFLPAPRSHHCHGCLALPTLTPLRTRHGPF